MSESVISIITILVLIVIPLFLFLLHVYLSTRKQWQWSLIVPVIWAVLGAGIIIMNIKIMGFVGELFLFFLAGVLILTATAIVLRSLNSNKKKDNADVLDPGEHGDQ